MNGVIAMANAGRNRYAVETDNGGFTIFELLEGATLEVGERVRGDLESVGSETFSVEGRACSVFVENYHCSASNAAAWVSG